MLYQTILNDIDSKLDELVEALGSNALCSTVSDQQRFVDWANSVRHSLYELDEEIEEHIDDYKCLEETA